MRRRSNISLYGNTSCKYGNTMFGTNDLNFNSNSYSQEFNDLKHFLKTTFLIPLINRKINILNLNAFNFEYITKKLTSYSHEFHDADIFLKLIDVIRSAMEIANENVLYTGAMHNDAKNTTLSYHTQTVEFLPEIQLYINLYGEPQKCGDFDNERVIKIRKILQATGMATYDNIKKQLDQLGFEEENIKIKT